MPIGDVVLKAPGDHRGLFEAWVDVLWAVAIARFENVEQGAMAHGINVDSLMTDLNAAVPQTSN